MISGNDLSAEFMAQFASNEKISESKKNTTQTENSTEPKKDYSETFILRLPKGERQRIKLWCTEKGISMQQAFYLAIDHLIQRVDFNEVTISKYGVKTK